MNLPGFACGSNIDAAGEKARALEILTVEFGCVGAFTGGKKRLPVRLSVAAKT